MEYVRLIDVDVYRVIAAQRSFVDVVLDGIYLMVLVILLPVDVAREAADAVIQRDDVGVELADEVVVTSDIRNGNILRAADALAQLPKQEE